MGSFEPTPEQRRAMEDRGGSLLVSAAAGSGKTKVLVERLFGYMERERCRIDDFLIITFTNAAAAELRGRIAAELSQRVARQPENMHLRRQMMLEFTHGTSDMHIGLFEAANRALLGQAT